jgi:alpha-2-macroglobulin
MATDAHRRPARWWRAVAVGLVAATLAAGCSSGDDDDGDAAPATTSTTRGTGSGTGTGTSAGDPIVVETLGLSLSEGHAQQAPSDPLEVVDGTPLDAAEIAAILERLPAWSGADELAEAFNWPAQSLPPPVAGQTIDVPFPPPSENGDPGGPGEVVAGPLEVVRFQPEGEVAVAPFVSITFNQPMVPLGTVEQLAEADVPATITPELPGRWQWIGTRTLRFDADTDLVDRLPMATTFHVEVPAGTRSASGSELAAAVAFDFETPPVTVQSFRPEGDSLPLEPVFLATFDQRVDAAAVLATVELRAGDEARPVRLATDAEIEADETVREVLGTLAEDRWIAFRPVEPLPTDTSITVEIGPDTPSAEGPRVSTEAASFRGRTYAPLQITRTECGYGPACPPGTNILVTFNNPLDADAFDPASIVVEPALPGMVVGAVGNVIEIRGATVAGTTYEITIPRGTTDVFGQTLAADETASVEIGPAVPMLLPFPQPLVTLDPLAGQQTVGVSSTNHERLRVQVFRVEPGDWDQYVTYMSEVVFQGRDDVPPPDWPLALDVEIATGTDPDRLGETAVDLGEVLGGQPGHVVVRVATTETYPVDTEEYWRNRPTLAWVQATSIGLDAVSDADELRVWATDLQSGVPLTGVNVELRGRDATVTTDADGLATTDLDATPIALVVATLGADTALLQQGWFGGSWRGFPVSDEARWYVIDDRQVYRPGETVSVKGWVRRLTLSGDAQLQLLADGSTVSYTARDAQGNEIATGTAATSPLGGFDLQLAIPAEANLGPAFLELSLSEEVGLPFSGQLHQFEIQEFRRPEFEVVARHESPGPYVSSRPATVAVDADYYAGGPLPAAPVTWQVTTESATYAPPGWDEFSFGEWIPWWDFGGSFGDNSRGFGDSCCGFPFPEDEVDVQEYQGTTDADGTHYLQIDFGAPDGGRPDLPVTVTAEATVEDVNRQAWASRTAVLVHPGELYVGLRSARTFVEAGDPLTIEAVVTDIDGDAVADRSVDVTAERLERVFEDGEWTEQPVEPQTCAVTSTSEPVTCDFTTSVGGTYRISATVVDDENGPSRTELTRWVTGGEGRPSRVVEQQEVTIVPDREEYRPGDTAELLVQAPFGGHGLLTISRNGIVSTQRFDAPDGSAVVELAITEDLVPGIGVAVEIVGATPRTADDGTPIPDAPLRPAFATGEVTLPISTASRTLSVTATPRTDTLAPGGTTQVDVTVTDAAGASVAGAELAVVVVDEAVLALSGYELLDPLAVFYGDLVTYLSSVYGRQSILLADPATLASGGTEAGSAGEAATTTVDAGGAVPTAEGLDSEQEMRDSAFDTSMADMDSAATGAPATPIGERTNFDPLAVFAPSVATDAAGTAVVDVPLPDNLTRYRVMVVAVAGADHYGSAESNITARLPLMVRPSAPRFANFGDAFELPVVVQNQTSTAMTVDVVLETANLTVDGPAGVRVEVPADDRVEVRFPVTTDEAGTARFRVAGVSGDAADATSVRLPVYTPATAEAFATYGVLDEGATIQPLLAPTDVVPQFGGLDVTTSSTSLQALTDAVLYVSRYEYEDTDAMASRILAISALRDVLEAFAADGLPSPAELDAAVTADIDGLVALQNDDGGFPWWQRNRPSEPYLTIEATHALLLARAGGYDVPDDTLARALSYLAVIEDHIPQEWGEDARDTAIAYALRVRMLSFDRDTGRAEALWDDRGEDLPIEAVAWIWPLIEDPATDQAIGRFFDNRAVETAGAASFTTEITDGAELILHSQRRTDGIVLDALISERPQSDLIPKVVTGLLGGRTAGRWSNIQENTFILLALKTYFDTYEAQTPDFVARVWLGDRSAGEHTFAGRSTDRAHIGVPTAELIALGDTDIVVAREGVGRLYYRLGLRYAPSDLTLDPLDRGFVVQRSYEAIDDPADVTRDADGTWHIRAGATVRVRLTMVAESQRTHVALIDPLPAGLEIQNPAFATTAELPPDPAEDDVTRPLCDWWCQPTWFDHQNMRDDRAEAFAAYLPGGTYDYSYVARATTPGTFVTPPARAEEVYAPETFGRAATDTVVVEG